MALEMNNLIPKWRETHRSSMETSSKDTLPIKICNNANEAAAEAETATTDADAIKAKEWHELTQPASLSLIRASISPGGTLHQIEVVVGMPW